MKIAYSIILSTYNWPQALNLILSSLLPQLQSNPDVELIIADDGSTSDTRQLINCYQKRLSGRIHHVWIEDMGFRKSVVLNTAVSSSLGDYLMFLDGDCIPFPDYIIKHKELAKSGYFVAGNRVLLSKDFTGCLIGGYVMPEEVFNWNLWSWILAKLSSKVNKVFSFLRIRADAKWRYARCDNWKYPKGCNIGMHKTDFVAVNGYDEIFSGWGHEDADLFIRLLHNGVKIKDGRFAIPVLHLWHKESSRANESSNYFLLMDRLADKSCILATDGIDKYIHQL